MKKPVSLMATTVSLALMALASAPDESMTLTAAEVASASSLALTVLVTPPTNPTTTVPAPR